MATRVGARKRGWWQCCFVGSGSGECCNMTMVNGGGCAIWLLAWEEGGDDYGFLVLEVEG